MGPAGFIPTHILQSRPEFMHFLTTLVWMYVYQPLFFISTKIKSGPGGLFPFFKDFIPYIRKT